MNVVILQGRLSGPPLGRELPSGDLLAAYQVTIANPDGRADTVPVSLLRPPAAALALDTGDEVVVVGRVRRRFFRSGATTQSRTEVWAAAVIPARHRRQVARVLEGTVARVHAAVAGGGRRLSSE